VKYYSLSNSVRTSPKAEDFIHKTVPVMNGRSTNITNISQFVQDLRLPRGGGKATFEQEISGGVRGGLMMACNRGDRLSMSVG